MKACFTTASRALDLVRASAGHARTPQASTGATAAPAKPEPSLIDRLINVPFVQNWNTWGLSASPRPHPAEGVTGGEALTINVARAGDPWSGGGVMIKTGEITTGDVLLLGIWIRAERLPEGVTETTIPLMMLEGNSEPKVRLVEASNVAIGTDWQMIYASGIATTDVAPGDSSIILQLGQAAHRLELGPALLLDFGPDYDPVRLPRNPDR